jgi:hypothetical protein
LIRKSFRFEFCKFIDSSMVYKYTNYDKSLLSYSKVDHLGGNCLG